MRHPAAISAARVLSPPGGRPPPVVAAHRTLHREPSAAAWKTPRTSIGRRPLQSVLDFLITLVIWIYFTAGFVFLFSPFYLWAGLFSDDREQAFQRLNSRFYRGLFALVRRLMPGHRWQVQPEVARIRSAVVVCNHRSYLDSIFLISLYERHNTIVKSRLFDIPVFGRFLQWSGYIPSSAAGRFSEMMIRRLEGMDAFLASGGNLIVFPEGTRSMDGRIGPLNKGAFKIARSCRAPVKVLFVRGTERMFRPGRFAFDTRGPNTISLELVGSVDVGAGREPGSLSQAMGRVRAMLEGQGTKAEGEREGKR
ncbi:MAG TPA: lysophospholipid acyltransferase family protein [Desulfosarcina sp.]|nr:lysophospholipid acyltransferase family protein [Desulfosarcina sp.]